MPVLLYPLPRGFRNSAGVGGNTGGDSPKAGSIARDLVSPPEIHLPAGLSAAKPRKSKGSFSCPGVGEGGKKDCKGKQEMRLPTDPDCPPSSLPPSSCFSIHWSARPSPLLHPPPRSTVGFRGAAAREAARDTEGKGRPGGVGGRKGRATEVIRGRKGSARVCPTTGLEEAVSGLPLRGASQSRVKCSPSSSSLLSWKPSLPAKHLGATSLLVRVLCAVAEMEAAFCF